MFVFGCPDESNLGGLGVRTNPDSKAFQSSLSSRLSIHKISPFWPSCGGRVFRNGKQRFVNSFPGSCLYFVCRCPFHGYIGEKMPGDGWRLIECAISCLFSMTISMRKRPRTWNTYFEAYSWMCRFHGYSEERNTSRGSGQKCRWSFLHALMVTSAKRVENNNFHVSMALAMKKYQNG